ncbi:hypothetical protein U9M48_003555 [Paspalum notatum var. saurae]|uniref:Uncharacterized protein n=1 Tax=Paspalum notatum var. saurae TaxID=547442 RepID=A0AAQ3SIA3_PASNO
MQGTAAAGAGGNAPSAWVAMAHNGSLVNYHALRNKSLRPGDPSSTCPLQFVAYNDDQNVIHAMAGSLLDKFEEKELQFLSKVENQEPIQWRIEQIDYKFCDKAVWIITEEAGCQRSPAIKDMELK